MLKRGATASQTRSGRAVVTRLGLAAVDQCCPVVAGRWVLAEDYRWVLAGANPWVLAEDYRYFLAADLVPIGIGAGDWIRDGYLTTIRV